MNFIIVFVENTHDCHIHTWNSLIDIGDPFSRICPRVGPCALRDMTSSRALLPDPLEPRIAVSSPPCTSRDTSLRMTPVRTDPTSFCRQVPGSTLN